MANAYPGMVADVQYDNHIESKLVETAAIAPGVVVSRGTDAEKQVVAGGVLPIGITVRDLAHENNTSDVLTYAVAEAVGVMTSGSLWVTIANTGSPGDPIKANTTTGAISAGEAGTGEIQLNGSLETTVSSNGTVGRIKLLEQTSATVTKKTALTVGHADLTDSDGAQSFDVVAIPANHIIVGYDVNVTEAFTDGAAGAFTFDLGIKGGDTDVFIDGGSLAAIARVDSPKGAGSLPSTLLLGGGTIAIDVKADVNVDTATAGAVTITAYYKDVSKAI
jgi:hypothetical protein